MGLLSKIAKRIFSGPPVSPVQQFLLAVEAGDIDAVRRTLDAHPDAVGWKSLNGHDQTPLMWAAGAGRKELCELLLARGAQVDERDSGGFTPFFSLVEGLIRGAAVLNPDPAAKFDPSDHQATALFLLSRGADINAESDDGRKPISRAMGGFTDTIEFLIDHGADFDKPDRHGNTLLMGAAAQGQDAIVELLLRRGASALRKNAQGRNSLEIAFSLSSGNPRHERTVGLLRAAVKAQKRLAKQQARDQALALQTTTQQPVSIRKPLKLAKKSL